MITILPNLPYLWRNPFLRIWSLGLTERVLEISTYPRARKDLSSHVDENGEAIEGSFPLWIEDDALPFNLTSDYVLDFTGMPVKADILEVEINKGDGWNPLTLSVLKRFVDAFKLLVANDTYGWYEGRISLPKLTTEPTKILVRVRYNRVLR